MKKFRDPCLAISECHNEHSSAITRRALLKKGAFAAGLLMAAPGVVWSSPRKESKYSRELLELLALALQHEHGAFVQYANHAGLLSHWIDNSMARTIQAIISDEVDHAVTLVETMKRAGAEPTLAVWPPQTANSPARVIAQDIAAEQGAVNLYNRILDFDMDDTLRKNIEDIVRAEQSHMEVFQNMLKNI